MAKKPAARKPVRAASLDEVKPSKAESLLRIETDDPFPQEEAEEVVPAKDADGKAAAKKASAKKATAKKAPAKKSTAKKPVVIQIGLPCWTRRAVAKSTW